MSVVLVNINYLKDVQILKTSDWKFNELYKIINKGKKVILFACPSWYKSMQLVKRVKFLVKIKKIVNYVVILYNDVSEREFYVETVKKEMPLHIQFFDFIYCNHNAFIDETMFTIENDDLDRQYDLVINARFSKYKNTNIAIKCENVVHIGYIIPSQNDRLIPTFGTIINPDGNFTKREEVNCILNKSMVGGIFSPIEGSCKASSEYLLAGLPCVSINSDGGRSIWYNENNSIICNNNEDDVKTAVKTCIEKLKNGSFNRQKIRNDHIEQSLIHRKWLIDYLLNKLDTMHILLTDDEKLKISNDIVSRH